MASNKITSIHDLLEQYNERIVNQRDKGTSFERLMKSYLELDPLYQDQFKTVLGATNFLPVNMVKHKT